MPMPNGIASATQIKYATMDQLIERYNELNKHLNGNTVLPIKKFSDRENAEKRVMALIAEAVKKDNAEAVAATKADKPAKAAKAEKPAKAAKPEKVAKPEAAAKAEKPAKPEKVAKAEKAPKEPKPPKAAKVPEGDSIYRMSKNANPLIRATNAGISKFQDGSNRKAVYDVIRAAYDAATEAAKGKPLAGVAGAITFNDLAAKFPAFDCRSYVSKLLTLEHVEILPNPAVAPLAETAK